MQITLKAARVNKGLSQQEAARIIGITDATLRNWERGKSFPDAMAIKSIENLYGVKYDDLIFLPYDYGLTVNRRS